MAQIMLPLHASSEDDNPQAPATAPRRPAASSQGQARPGSAAHAHATRRQPCPPDQPPSLMTIFISAHDVGRRPSLGGGVMMGSMFFLMLFLVQQSSSSLSSFSPVFFSVTSSCVYSPPRSFFHACSFRPFFFFLLLPHYIPPVVGHEHFRLPDSASSPCSLQGPDHRWQ